MNERDDGLAADALRSAAERLLSERPEAPRQAANSLQHQLSIHQIELELQNEALRNTVAQLQQSRDRLLDLYDFAPTGYMTLDEQGVISEANLRTAQLLGMDRASLIGRSFALYTTPECRTRLMQMLQASPRREETVTTELTLLRQDGQTVPVRLEWLSRAPGTLRVSMMDITAERTARDELTRLNGLLEERVQSRTRRIFELGEEFEQVTLGVTEDLSLALRRVTSFVDLVRRETPVISETQQAHLQQVFLSVNRVEGLTAAMLDYVRVSRMRLQNVPVDLNRVFTEVVKDLEPQLAERSVQLSSTVLPVVSGDSTALQVILRQLLDNAVKFSAGKDRAVITVSAEETDMEVILCVEDNGAGFNNRHQGRLFTLFKRLHPETSFGGVGMGLAIVRRLCLRSGARVWGEGRPGEGATFCVAWPKQEEYGQSQ